MRQRRLCPASNTRTISVKRLHDAICIDPLRAGRWSGLSAVSCHAKLNVEYRCDLRAKQIVPLRISIAADSDPCENPLREDLTALRVVFNAALRLRMRAQKISNFLTGTRHARRACHHVHYLVGCLQRRGLEPELSALACEVRE